MTLKTEHAAAQRKQKTAALWMENASQKTSYIKPRSRRKTHRQSNISGSRVPLSRKDSVTITTLSNMNPQQVLLNCLNTFGNWKSKRATIASNGPSSRGHLPTILAQKDANYVWPRNIISSQLLSKSPSTVAQNSYPTAGIEISTNLRDSALPSNSFHGNTVDTQVYLTFSIGMFIIVHDQCFCFVLCNVV